MGRETLQQQLAPAGLLATEAVEGIGAGRTPGKALPKALPEAMGLVSLAGGSLALVMSGIWTKSS
jgi:hypothetical protein